MPSIKTAIVLFTVYLLALAAPVPDTSNQVDNSYSGAGGHAVGGSVTHNTVSGTRLLGGLGLVKLFSDNAGKGGSAKSGSAFSSTPNNLRVGGSTSGAGDTTNSVGNAFSGAAGNADGGSVTGEGDALISLFSGNAGNGGVADSGTVGLLPTKKTTGNRTTRVGRATRVSRFIQLRLD